MQVFKFKKKIKLQRTNTSPGLNTPDDAEPVDALNQEEFVSICIISNDYSRKINITGQNC